MSTIILYTYLIGYVLFYIFLQLNYTFSWFKEIELGDAFDCVFMGLFVSLSWPLIIIICLVMKLMVWMDSVHNKHKFQRND